MKKQIITLLSISLLASCSVGREELKLSVASPSGAPALSFYDHLGDKNLEISSAQTVVSYFSSGTKDIVILPTDTGVKMIQKEANPAPYKLAATITFGNFFLASSGNDSNKALDKDDYVVVFQKNSVPDMLFKYVYGNDFSNIHYVSDVNAAARCLISGKNESDMNASIDYVLMAEPALTTALKQNGKASIHSNLQTIYKEKTGGKEIVQASIFVSNNADQREAKRLLDSIESDINDLLSNPERLDGSLLDSGLEGEAIAQKIGNPTLIKELLINGNKIGIGFKSAFDNKENIDAFLTALGGSETLDSTYFK